MFKQFTQHIDENQVYLILSLSIFFAFFIVMSIMLWRWRKSFTDYMSAMPLHDNNANNLNQIEP